MTTVNISRSDFPKFLYDNEEPPLKGWAIVGFGQVYKDAKPAGSFEEMYIRADGKSKLTFEDFGDGLSRKQLLA
jgi:hypothetical protein